MKEVLLPLGTVCLLPFGADELEFMIIGHRQFNAADGKSYDYISVPYPWGYNNSDSRFAMIKNSNLYFFNHTEIICTRNASIGEKCKGSEEHA